MQRVVALALAGVSLAACGSDAASSPSGSAGSVGSTPPAAAGAGTSLGDLLALAPAVGAADGVTIEYIDLDAVSELLGIQRPRGADSATVDAWVEAIRHDTSDDGSQAAVALVPGPLRMPGTSSVAASTIGWNLGDVAALADIDDNLDEIVVATGDVETADLDAVATTDGDVWSIAEGDDFAQDPDLLSAVNELGIPLRLAWRDGVVAVTRTTASAQAFATGTPTLTSGEPLLAAVAAPMTARDVYGAVLIRLTTARPGSYDAHAVGQAVIDGQRLAIWAYHPSPDTTVEALAALAEEALSTGSSQRLGVTWSELFPGASVGTEGDVVVLTLPLAPTTSPEFVWDMMHLGDPVVIA